MTIAGATRRYRKLNALHCFGLFAAIATKVSLPISAFSTICKGGVTVSRFGCRSSKCGALTSLLRDDNNEQPGPVNDEQNVKDRQDRFESLRSTERRLPFDDGSESNSPASLEEDVRGDVTIPSAGISVNDEIVSSQQDKFFTKLVPLREKAGVAKILTMTSENTDSGDDEPIRYLVALSLPPPRATTTKVKDDKNGFETETVKHKEQQGRRSDGSAVEKYVLVDIPPYCDSLATKMRHFMGRSSKLCAILVTSRDSIHYDESPAVYVTRKSDIQRWIRAFPGVEIVMYRLDTPRDCKSMVTQLLDGYGPWALDEFGNNEPKKTDSNKFVETGRPLTVLEWDEETQSRVLDNGETPPDDNEDNDNQTQKDDSGDDDSHLYTPEAIRNREMDKRILAIYTPGHTCGSLTYIFPDMELCCSGFAIPLEDTRALDNNIATGGGAGPNLDYRGYITTSKGGVDRQVESARRVIIQYGDRFNAILPSSGDVLFLNGSTKDRTRLLLSAVDQFGKVGRIYEQLGIISLD